MTRYDLIVKKVDGCASARVEKHELGSFVKYVDVMEDITENKLRIANLERGSDEMVIIIADLRLSLKEQGE